MAVATVRRCTFFKAGTPSAASRLMIVTTTMISTKLKAAFCRGADRREIARRGGAGREGGMVDKGGGEAERERRLGAAGGPQAEAGPHSAHPTSPQGRTAEKWGERRAAVAVAPVGLGRARRPARLDTPQKTPETICHLLSDIPSENSRIFFR